MKYAKAIIAALLAGLGSISEALATNPAGGPALTSGQLLLAVCFALGGGGFTALIKNKGTLFLDKLGVTEEQVKRALQNRGYTGE